MVVFRYQLKFHTNQSILGLDYTNFNNPVDDLVPSTTPTESTNRDQNKYTLNN